MRCARIVFIVALLAAGGWRAAAEEPPAAETALPPVDPALAASLRALDETEARLHEIAEALATAPSRTDRRRLRAEQRTLARKHAALLRGLDRRLFGPRPVRIPAAEADGLLQEEFNVRQERVDAILESDVDRRLPQ